MPHLTLYGAQDPSPEPLDWARVPNTVLRNKDISDAAVRVLAALLSEMINPRATSSYDSIANIARKAGKAKRTVQVHLHELERHGIIERHQDHSRPGSPWKTVFRFRLKGRTDPPAQSTQPAPAPPPELDSYAPGGAGSCAPTGPKSESGQMTGGAQTSAPHRADPCARGRRILRPPAQGSAPHSQSLKESTERTSERPCAALPQGAGGGPRRPQTKNPLEEIGRPDALRSPLQADPGAPDAQAAAGAPRAQADDAPPDAEHAARWREYAALPGRFGDVARDYCARWGIAVPAPANGAGATKGTTPGSLAKVPPGSDAKATTEPNPAQINTDGGEGQDVQKK